MSVVMGAAEWVVIGTETADLTQPVSVVELAAQRMRGWEPESAPFRRILNEGTHTPPEGSRVKDLTLEILERDGEPPPDAYQAFAQYVGNRPLCSYNLAYNWGDVLLPAWRHLGVAPVGTYGLCLLKLAQRLLDPVAAGNCKLQTLRQYYRLPQRGAHTALGDVETVIDLAQQVLRPLAEARGLNTWAELNAFSESTWFPARITFGKFKGRMFREARQDPELRAWLEWLGSSSNRRSAQIGVWYLAQLEVPDQRISPLTGVANDAFGRSPSVVIYTSPDLARLQALVERARNRLAELETTYTRERQAVSVMEARLFELLRPLSQKRDLLKLRLDYLLRYLDALFESGEEDAAEVEHAYERAREETNTGYEEAAAQSADRRPLNAGDEPELKALWRKLVKLFHPDRITDDEDKRATYQRLMAEINRARDQGNMDRLREIAGDPLGFIIRQGWSGIDLGDVRDMGKLQHLYEMLEAQIIEALERLDALRASPEFELYQLTEGRPKLLDNVSTTQRQGLKDEIAALDAEITRVEAEIEAVQA